MKKIRTKMILIALLFGVISEAKVVNPIIDYHLYPGDQIKEKYFEELHEHIEIRWDDDNTFIEDGEIRDSIAFLINYVDNFIFFPTAMQFILVDLTILYGPYSMMLENYHFIRCCKYREYQQLINYLQDLNRRSQFNPKRLDVHIKYLEYSKFMGVWAF